MLCAMVGITPAQADPQTTRDALDRLDELLEVRLQDGRLEKKDLVPAIVVSLEPRYLETEPWFGTRTLEVIQAALGEGNVRLCEACMAPRAYAQDGALAYQTGPIGLDEVIRLDDQLRGKSAPARTGIWVEEHQTGVAVRIIDLRNGNILFARNVDPNLIENERTQRIYTFAEELERRARGDSITQSFVDFGIYPGQHVSVDWTDQWGDKNRNFTGFTLSLFDPVLGIGANYYFVTPFLRSIVGGKLIMSVPTGLVRAINTSDNPIDLVDPLLTGVFVLRVPIGRSNYGIFSSVSTNGQFTVGISLLNFSPLPFLP